MLELQQNTLFLQVRAWIGTGKQRCLIPSLISLTRWAQSHEAPARLLLSCRRRRAPRRSWSISNYQSLRSRMHCFKPLVVATKHTACLHVSYVLRISDMPWEAGYSCSVCGDVRSWGKEGKNDGGERKWILDVRAELPLTTVRGDYNVNTKIHKPLRKPTAYY